jgi:hypothetical protein
MQDVTTDTNAGRVAPATRGGQPTLESLARMSFDELGALYRKGRVPASLKALEGAPRGRMLALVGALGRGAPHAVLRTVARSRAFPWLGKTFRARESERGEGINRVRLLGTREWFPFSTRIDPSAIDGAPCVLLDYDREENPFFIRRIRDELREVAPGLFLGPAMWKTSGAPFTVL